MTDAERPSNTVSLNWKGGFRFESRDSNGHSLTLDAPQSDGAKFEGFMPGDMLLTALAGCSGIDVVNILERMRQNVEGIEISVRGHQNPEPPWAYEDIEIHYTIRGSGLKENLVRRAINLSENKYCSIGATVSGRARITSDFDIVET